jgi:hypothetical protein
MTNNPFWTGSEGHEDEDAAQHGSGTETPYLVYVDGVLRQDLLASEIVNGERRFALKIANLPNPKDDPEIIVDHWGSKLRVVPGEHGWADLEWADDVVSNEDLDAS